MKERRRPSRTAPKLNRVSLGDGPDVGDRRRAELGFGVNALQGLHGGRLDHYRNPARILSVGPFALGVRDTGGKGLQTPGDSSRRLSFRNHDHYSWHSGDSRSGRHTEPPPLGVRQLG
jgi:hypothetical protein